MAVTQIKLWVRDQEGINVKFRQIQRVKDAVNDGISEMQDIAENLHRVLRPYEPSLKIWIETSEVVFVIHEGGKENIPVIR